MHVRSPCDPRSWYLSWYHAASSSPAGTWSSYPLEYQEEFCRDLFFAANTFGTRFGLQRERKSLAEEQTLNESATCKIIGLTLEMRPDNIDAEELHRLRRYGCTRVQLGVQHTDDAILTKINRQCTTQQVRQSATQQVPRGLAEMPVAGR